MLSETYMDYDERDDSDYLEEAQQKWERLGIMKTVEHFEISPRSPAGAALAEHQKVFVEALVGVIRMAIKEREELLPHLHSPPRTDLMGDRNIRRFLKDSFEMAFEQYIREISL